MYGYRIAGGIVAAFATSLIAGCGGGGGGGPKNPPTPPTTFTVAGTVSGLAGSGLVLQNNGGNNLAVAQNGSFTFTTGLANGTGYTVSVLTQPSSPTQACTVANSTGTITGNVTNVAVTCVTGAFTVGGSVSGLATNAPGFVITNNGGDQLVINANGAFTFPTPAASGSNYSIGVLSLPYDPYQTCTVENGSGVVTNSAITAPTITCTTLVPKFASSLDFGTATYSQYAIDASTGQLRARGFVPVGTNPVDVGAHGLDARISFVLSRGSGWLHAFLRDPVTGRVTEGENSPQSTGAVLPGGSTTLGAATLTVHPKQPFVYVANGGGASTIAGFRFDPATAALTPLSGSPFAAGNRPIKLAIESTGRFGFAVNLDSETISAFSIDQTTGALTPNGNALPIGATLPVYPVIHPSGKFVYVPTNSGSIAAFSIGTTGALTAVTNSPFAVTPSLTSPILFHPSGKYLFVKALAGNVDGSVTALAINENTGALSIIGAPVNVGINPTTIWSEGSGRYLFVANRGAAPQTPATTGSISILRINQSNGELTTSQTIAPLQPSPYSVSLDWSGKYLYSASAEGNIVRTYAFNFTTGAATPIDDVGTMFVRGAPLTLLAIPSATAEPAKFRSKFAYVPNFGASSVLAYSINAGVVTPTGGASGTELAGVQAVAVTPHSTRLVAVNNFGTANATTLPINSTTGALGTPTSAALAGTGPVAVVAEPSGRFAYAADRTSNVIHAFAINASNGNLTAIGTSAATDPFGLAIHPNGRFIYHVSGSQWGVRTIDTTTGALSSAVDRTEGGNNTAIAIHPGGRFAYVTRAGTPGQIDRYDVLSSGLVGQLANVTTIQSPGTDPIAVVVHPTGRFAYVANNLSSDIAAFRVRASDGALTLIGSVTNLSSRPLSIRADYSGNYLYVVDSTPQIRTFAINTTTGELAASAATAPPAAAQQLAVSEDIE